MREYKVNFMVNGVFDSELVEATSKEEAMELLLDWVIDQSEPDEIIEGLKSVTIILNNEETSYTVLEAVVA